MSHEEFLSQIYSRLSTIISSDPLLSDIHDHPSKISFAKFNPSPLISISIRRFDDSLLHVHIPKDARVFQLKRAIQKTFLEKNIHWKSIWKRYVLSTNEHQQQLINDNRRIQYYGVSNNSELSFVRRRRLK